MPPSSSEQRLAAAHVVVAIGLMSLALMCFELALVRIFSLLLWHHFAFMVLSVSLLGLAVSGVLVTIWPGLGTPPVRRAAIYALLFGATAWLATLVVSRIPFDSTQIANDPREVLCLAAYYVVLVPPFVFGGLAVVTLLNGFTGQVERLYGGDLVGAGLGCLAAVTLTPVVEMQGVVLLATFAAAAAAALLGPARPLRLVAGLVALITLSAIPRATDLLPLTPGRGKAYHSLVGPNSDATVALVRSNALARIDVIENAGPVSWSTSPGSAKPPSQTQILIDGDAATPIVTWHGALSELAFLDSTIPSFGAQALRPQRVLVLGAGGGIDVLTALRNGARSIDAVEINPIIADLMRGAYAKQSGRLFSHDGVTLYVGEGRSFVRDSDTQYDLIQLSLVDTWAASAAGAYGLSEAYLYTVEAFTDYLMHLRRGGVISITRWILSGEHPRETMKLCTVAVAALRRLGVKHPGAHVVIGTERYLANVLIKREPFTGDDLRSLIAVAKRRGFGFAYAPGAGIDTPYTRLLTARSPEEIIARYPYDIEPATDDSPFFFQFGRWGDLVRGGTAWRDVSHVLSGRMVLATVLLQGVALSAVLLAFPLWWRGKRRLERSPAPRGAILYFVLIGIGFMLVEVSLMQRFTLYLGHPMYAISLVLAVLLFGAGAGSALARRLAPVARRPVPLFFVLAGVLVAYGFLLPVVFRGTLGLALTARIALSALMVFLVGFPLGVPFPSALARLGAGDGGTVGRVWAANGFGSVVGPILATMLAIDLGFQNVLLIAAAVYLAAFGVFNWCPATSAPNRHDRPRP